MLGRRSVDKQNPIYEFVQVCLLHTPSSLYYMGSCLLLCPICPGSAVDSNQSSTIPKVFGDRASGPCLCCRKVLSRRFDVACVDRDITSPPRSVENNILLLEQLLRDCCLVGADARGEFSHCKSVGWVIPPCGVGALEAQPDPGRKKPIHAIVFSMNQLHNHGHIND